MHNEKPDELGERLRQLRQGRALSMRHLAQASGMSANALSMIERGLEWTATYEVDGIAGTKSGAGWMQGGIGVKLGNLESTIRRIRQV